MKSREFDKLTAPDLEDNDIAEGEEGEELYEHFAIVVDKGQSLMRIDRYLATHMEACSRSRIQAAADCGNILVDGKAVKSSYKVKPLERISIVMPYPKRDTTLVPQNIPVEIVYEDDQLLVVNKRAGMVVHPGHGNWDGTLVNALAYHLRESELFEEGRGDIRAGLVHRIDKNTSGLLVVAKTEYAHAFLAHQFFEHTITRRYLALVWGNFEEDEGTVVANVGRSKTDPMNMAAYPDGSYGKHAVTHYKVLRRYGYVTLIECRLETGRTHQIRVHMASVGHPLLGDTVYGGANTRFESRHRSSIIGQCLHAGELRLTHPRTGEEMQFTAPMPQNMQHVVDILFKNDESLGE